MTKREKSTLVKGAAIGILAGSLLPDSVNPIFWIRRAIAAAGAAQP